MANFRPATNLAWAHRPGLGTWKTTKGKGSYLDGIKKPLDQSIYQMILIYFKDRQL